MAVTSAAAGQNGFGSASGTPALQGNGNQEDEEEAQEAEEPVRPQLLLWCCLCATQCRIDG